MLGERLNEQESFRILDYALEKGITYVDTAEWYGNGRSEQVIGNWMHQRGCRDKITVGTKFYLDSAPTWGNREYIRKALDASLSRLRTDYIDIYLMHYPDPTVPIEETLSALSEEIEGGRVRTIGFSNFNTRQLQEGLDASASGGYQRFAVQQPEYGLVAPLLTWPGTVPGTLYVEDPDYSLVGLYELEDQLFPICQRENIASTIFSPLGAGFLSGQYTPGASLPDGSRARWDGTYVGRRLTERNFQILDKLQAKASELGMSTYNLAMAWAMTHPAVTSTITGARRLEHIDNALEASEIRLEPDLRAEMTAWIR